jgi:voltage-gated potassium channel
MSRAELRRAAPLLFTVGLMALVIAASHQPGRWEFTAVSAIALGGASIALHLLFPHSRFFVLALANSLAVYASMYVVFINANFPRADAAAVAAAFLLPVLAFLAGAWLRRSRIRAIITQTRPSDRVALARGAGWLVPVLAIGLFSFAAPDVLPERSNLVLLLAMLSIAAIVFAVSADVATFLVDAGLLFDEFFTRARALAVPAFAFLTFYSVIVIVFASIYRLMGRVEGATHFTVASQPHALDFSQSLYFSLMTMATVGYGDIVPASEAARMVAGVQVVLGVLLLLFGFSELMAYAREQRRPGA